MIKVKSSQKVFTDTETATLTGICLEHLHNLARTRHIGFIVRAAAAAGNKADQGLFTVSALTGLAALDRPCQHLTPAATLCRRLLTPGFCPDSGGPREFSRS